MRRFIDLLREARREYERDYARYYAVAIVYYALVSLVPLLLLLLATLGLVLHLSEQAAAAEHAVLETVGASLGPELQTTLEDLLQRLKNDSAVVTFISLVGLLLAASVLFKHLRLTFRAVWGKDPPLASRSLFVAIRATVLERAIAFVMVLGGGALLLAAFVILTAVQWLAKLANSLPMIGTQVAFLFALPAPVVIATATFALFFKVLPPLSLSWRHVWLASVICGVAWVIGAEALTLYGSFVGRSVGPYGALGAVLVVMPWMNLISQMLFIGAELCKVVYSSEHSPTEALATSASCEVD